jgi:hypothetical protein
MGIACAAGVRFWVRKGFQGLADNLVPVLVWMFMAPLKIVLLFNTSRSRELTISLVVLGHVLVVHLVFILVPLVVVTSVFVVVPLGLVV